MNQIRRRISGLFFPHLYQADIIECGTVSLNIVMKYYGMPDIRGLLNQMAQVNEEGTSVFMLKELAEKFGFEVKGFRLGYEDLKITKLPCIAHYDGNHFVVIYKYNEKYVTVSDPGIGKLKIKKQDFVKKWNGVTLQLSPTATLFKSKDIQALLQNRKIGFNKIVGHFYTSILYASRGLIAGLCLISFLFLLLGLVQPLLLKVIIDDVLVKQNNPLLGLILSGVFLAFLFQSLLAFIRDKWLNKFKSRFELDFYTLFFKHFIHLRQSFFDKRKREELIYRFQQNMHLRSIISVPVVEGIIEIPLIILYFIILAIFSTKIALISSFFIIVIFILMIFLAKKMQTIGRKIYSEGSKSLWSLLDSILGIQNIKLLNAEEVQFSKWHEQYKKNVDTAEQTGNEQVCISALLRGIYTLAQVTVFGLGAHFTLTKKISAGEYIASLFLFNLLISRISGMVGLWFLFSNLKVLFTNLLDTMQQETEISQTFKTTELPHIEKITFRDVSFSYAKGIEPDVLSHIGFEINKGEYIGIVGRNGSGKSTLVKLIAKIYDDFQGSILINDEDINDINPKALREKVFMIPQEVELFSDTIRANIAYGVENATMEQIVNSAKLAQIDDFIQNKYLNYETRIGSTGTKLSTGQKLKIAFARLFMRMPDVIILDEASSALDIEAEQLIMQNLKKRYQHKIIISVAHRITTLKNADKIMVVDNGQIVETGSHNDLFNKKSLYRQFIQTYLDY